MSVVAGTQVRGVQMGDTVAAVRTDVLVDTETGLIVERDTLLAVNDRGEVVARQRTRLAKLVPFRYVQFCTQFNSLALENWAALQK